MMRQLECQNILLRSKYTTMYFSYHTSFSTSAIIYSGDQKAVKKQEKEVGLEFPLSLNFRFGLVRFISSNISPCFQFILRWTPIDGIDFAMMNLMIHQVIFKKYVSLL